MKKELIYNLSEIKQPCIYLLCSIAYEGAWKRYFKLREVVVYVGQSKNGLARALQHVYNKEFDYIKIIPCKLSELDKIEKKYIQYYRPGYNNRDRPCELPPRCGWENLGCFNCKYASEMKNYYEEDLKGTYINCKKEKRKKPYYFKCEKYKRKAIQIKE